MDVGKFILLLLFGAVAGIRHGIDFDHIAAITDITSSKEKGRGIWFVSLYGLGHGIVVLFLGVLLIAIGRTLPESLDKLFGKFVGITLLLLGLYVFYSLYRYGRNSRFRSRWMLVLSAFQAGYHTFLHRFGFSHEHPRKHEANYGSGSAFAIGMVHGVGAETPTQVAALAAVLGVGAGVRGMVFLLFFVGGIFVSNLLVATASAFGFLKAKKQNMLYTLVGLLTAIFSLTVGILFLLF
jgi:high-affinity nickel-transport protein